MHHAELTKMQVTAIWVNVILTTGSTVFTYEGLIYSGAASVFQATLRVGIAAVISIVGWWIFFRYYPISNKSQRQVMNIGIAGISLLMVSLSSIYGTVGLSAERLTKIHLQENLKSIEEVRDELIKRRRGIEALKGSLENGRTAFLTFAEQEQNGLISGRRGKNRVFKSIKGFSKAFDSIIESIDEYATATDFLEQKSLTLCKELRSVVDGELSIPEKNQASQVLFNKINALFAEMQQTPAFSNWIQNMDSVFIVDTEKNEAVTKSLATPIRKVKSSLLEQIEGFPRVDEVHWERFVVLDSLQLTIRYIHLCFAEISGILCTDIFGNIFVLWALVFLQNRFRDHSNSQSAHLEMEASHGQGSTGNSNFDQMPEWIAQRIKEQTERKSKGNKKGKAA